jgi:predicted transcriptional regulator YheO
VRHIRSLANRVLNKQGEVERLLGINMDMTEVKQLNEACSRKKSVCTLPSTPSVKRCCVPIST